MEFDEAEHIIHNLMTFDDRVKIAHIVRDSATDALGDAPDGGGGFIGDVLSAADKYITTRGGRWDLVIEAYLDVVLGDAETPEEYISQHRKLMAEYGK